MLIRPEEVGDRKFDSALARQLINRHTFPAFRQVHPKAQSSVRLIPGDFLREMLAHRRDHCVESRSVNPSGSLQVSVEVTFLYELMQDNLQEEAVAFVARPLEPEHGLRSLDRQCYPAQPQTGQECF